jgi:hypothetical protein
VSGYEPNYEGSAVVIGPRGGVCSAHGEHMVKARAGHHLTPRPCPPAAMYSTNWDRNSRCWHSMRRMTRSLVRAGSETLGASIKVVRDTYRDGREA